MTSPLLTRPWERLDAAVRSGNSSFEEVHGAPFFEHLKTLPDEAAVFDAAMTSEAPARAVALQAALDWSDVGTVVDIGGGQGLLLGALLELVPGPKGVIADQESVVKDVPAGVVPAEVAPRIEYTACDFFDAVPEAATSMSCRASCTTGTIETAVASSIVRRCGRVTAVRRRHRGVQRPRRA